ncbi:MAG: thioredoxin family protein [Candidatus Asgardarchaeia archaeon]
MPLIPEEDAKKLHEKFSVMEKVVKIKFYQTADCETCADMSQLLEELATLADQKISIEYYDISEAPEFLRDGGKGPIMVMGDNNEVIYLGSPLGHEAWAFIETIVMLSTGNSQLEDHFKEHLKDLKKNLVVETIVTPTCPYCPYAVLMANQIAIETKGKIVSVPVNAWEFQDLAVIYNVTAVPVTTIGPEIKKGSVAFVGVPHLHDFIEKLLAA